MKKVEYQKGINHKIKRLFNTFHGSEVGSNFSSDIQTLTIKLDI